jgi:nucleotide-binding universal stress UspA family protein
MYQFKRLLVCLDHSEMDDTLIKAASEYASFGHADNIYFVTAVKSLEAPESIKRDYPDLHTPLDEQMEREMKDSIKGLITTTNCSFHFDVLEGDPTKQIIRWAKLKEVDLIILGKKAHKVARGLTAQNIVNISHSSVLFVTENCSIEPKSILVPTDFSEASSFAFQKALTISKAVSASLTCLHTYEVPTGYHSTGKTYDEFAEIMLQHSEQDCNEFIKKHDNLPENIEIEYLLDKHGNPDQLISEFATKKGMDLIIVGSRGRTALSSVLLGSIAAKLVLIDFNVPILIVKGKDQNLNLIDAIFQL